MTFETQPSPDPHVTQPAGYLLSTVSILTIATAAVAMVFGLARAFGDELRVAPEFSSAPATEAELSVVIVATLMLGALGLGLARLIGRFLPKPRLVFVAGSLIGLTGYGVLAFIKADTEATAMWLNVMHLVAAVPIVGGALSHRTRFLPVL